MRYFCEFCGKKFHNPIAAIECSRTEVCRHFGFPPREVVGNYRVRCCALTLAKTAAELMQKSPAGKTRPEVFAMGERIIKWAHRAEEAMATGTPIALGKKTRIHNGLVDFVWANVWKRKEPLPNLHALELAHLYATDAKELVAEAIEKGQTSKFWFMDEHPEYLLLSPVNMPLATYITGMKNRKMIDKDLDAAILEWEKSGGEKKAGPDLVGKMLEHCWRDELRNWNFLLGSMETAMKWIKKNGTANSLDLSRHNASEKYEILMAYIWDEQTIKKNYPELKLWLVDERFWVIAHSRQAAKQVLVQGSGIIAKNVQGIPSGKKLYDEAGLVAETAGEILAKANRPTIYGVER